MWFFLLGLLWGVFVVCGMFDFVVDFGWIYVELMGKDVFVVGV